MSKKTEDRFGIAASFFLPVFLLLIFFIYRGITPFGNNTFLIHDMKHQYVDFFAYYKTVLAGKNDFHYSLSRGLGGDFISLWAYYLANPFNLICVLCPDEWMPMGISAEMLLLFGLAGCSAYCSLRRFVPDGSHMTCLFFSLAYSLSAWMVLNAENFQFLPSAALLPVTIAAVDDMKKTGRIRYAAIFLALTLAMNFYIGYMVFIFAMLWLLIPDGSRLQPRMLLAFVIAGVICLPILLPVVLQLPGSVKESDPMWFMPGFNFSVLDGLRKFLPGQFDSAQYRDNGLPAVYCSIISLICVIIRLFQKDHPKEKRHHFILLGILLFSLIFRPLSLAWQGFSAPRWWPYRFSFLLIFMILLIAQESRVRIPWFVLLLGVGGLYFNLDRTFTVKLAEAVPLDQYADAVRSKHTAIDSIMSSDGGVYRIEDTDPRSDNDPMHFGYSGITSFDSLARQNVMKFLNGIGFPVDRYTVSYGLGNTRFTNALLGVRYVLDNGSVHSDDIPVGLAFIVDSPEITDELSNTDAVSIQNELAATAGSAEPILEPLQPVDIAFENLECSEVFCWKYDSDEPAYIYYSFHSDIAGSIYAHAEQTFIIGDMSFITDDEKIDLNELDYFLPVGRIDPNHERLLSVEVSDPVADVLQISFWIENSELVNQIAAEMYRDINIRQKSSSEFNISFPESDKARTLVVTVPYDSRWVVSSRDGRMTACRAWETFLAIPVPAGYTEIDIKYR